jgi:hypothetical protein
MGWITHRHGVIYTREYGWDEHFEALVAQICADFINNFDPHKEYCWIAEMNGEMVGSVVLAKADEEGVAKLRLLLVEAKARGYWLERAWWKNASASPSARGIKKSSYGPIAFWWKPVTSTKKRGLPWSRPSRITVSAMIWSGKLGNCLCSLRLCGRHHPPCLLFSKQ